MTARRVQEIHRSHSRGEEWREESLTTARRFSRRIFWKDVRQFVQSLEAMGYTIEASKRALGSSASERAQRDSDLDLALSRALAKLYQRKTELGRLPRSGLMNQAHLMMEAGLTMATTGVLFMQSGLQQQDDRAIAFGAEQYSEGMIHLAQGAHAIVQLTDETHYDYSPGGLMSGQG